EELRIAVVDGAKIIFGANIELDAGIMIPNNAAVDIDLGGYTLTGADDTYVIRATNKSTLTVKNGTIKVGEYDENWSWGIDNRGGNVTVEDVRFEAVGNYFGDAVTANWDWDFVSGNEEEGYYLDEDGIAASTILNNVTVSENADYCAEVYNYSKNKITINSGTFNGDVYNAGSLVINGGTIKSYIYNDAQTINISGGDFSNAEIYNNNGTMTVNSPITLKSLTTSPMDLSNITYDEFLLTGTITEGEYTVNGLYNATIPANSTAKIHLDNAEISGGANTIAGGSFDGTVSSISNRCISGGIFSDELYEQIKDKAYKFSTGYGWIENTDGTYTVGYLGTIKVNIKSNNKDWGNAGVSKYAIGGSSGSGSLDEVANKSVTKGDTIKFSAKAVPKNDNYVFAGWYTNSEGEGSSISVAAQLTDFEYVVGNEDITIYAVFKEDEEYKEFVAKAKDWVNSGDYTINSTDDMYMLAFAVNNLGETFSGKTVTLTVNLDYTDNSNFMPVGGAVKFLGTFDGGKHTISNLKYTAADGGYAGIFGYNKGTIKNLKVDNCEFNTSSDVGGIAAWSEGRIEDCSVTGCVLNGGFRYAGCIVGHTYGITMTNIVASNNNIKGWKAGGVVGYADGLKLSNATVVGNTNSDETETGLYGAVVGHLNEGASTMENITVNAPNAPIIGTNYSTTRGNLVVSGENTNVTAENIIPENTVPYKTIEISDGSYKLNSIVPDGKEKQGVTLVGGNYTTNVEEYVPEGIIWKVSSDGIYVVRDTVAEIHNTAKTVSSTVELDKADMCGVVDTLADATYKVVVNKASNEGTDEISKAIEDNNESDKKLEIIDIRIFEIKDDVHTDITSDVNSKLSEENKTIKAIYTLPEVPVEDSVSVYHYTSAGVCDKLDSNEFSVNGKVVTITAESFSDWAITYDVASGIVYEVTNKIGVSFEYESDGVYNILLRPQDDKDTIYRFMSADLTFSLDTTEGNLVYTVEAAPYVNITSPSENRYEFNLDGIHNSGVISSAVKIGQVKFDGYGEGKFSVATADTNIVNTAEYGSVDDNIVAHYTAGGSHTLALNDDVTNTNGTIDPLSMKPERKALTVNIAFPNKIDNNAAAYQAMTVTVSGGDLTTPLTYALGNNTENVSFNNNTYTLTVENTLTKNTSYTVTVSGAGYRTARYTVNMATDKTLNFWNNVMDTEQVVEVDKQDSAVKTNFLAGDIVKDNNINIYDLSAVVSYFGTSNDVTAESAYARYDLNRDGKIDSKDVAYVLVSWNN
ncbi:MAG: InlB B-repeat-containing protein, partial [Monoglobaceae bacterium]